jgi:AraC-like DNA-binding protein/ligand-binding sensor protein
MTSAPGIELLPLEEQQPFAQEFQKDVEFFKLLILMISKSLATGSVDITWMDGHEGLRQVIGTTEAAKSPCSRYLQWDREDPSQRFCNIVSDFTRRVAESCAVCENAAEKRVGQSGRTQVYRCHAGLTDIAVPVIADGKHIATLYSGQVLTAPPSKAGFERVAKDVSRLTYIKLKDLKKAYWEVPVVSEEDIENTIHILELFAEYLARFSKRLGDTVKAEHRKMRVDQLAAEEFAYMILQPEAADRARICQLMKQLRFRQPPNRVLVAKLPSEEDFDSRAVSFDLEFTTALQTIEELAKKTSDMTVAYLRRRGVCVIFRDITDGPSAGLRARALAEKILYEISSRCNIRARIGIGGLKPGWLDLAESYHEACLALAGSDDLIAICGDSAPMLSELTIQIEVACRQLADQQIQDARVTLRALPLLANRRFGSSAVADHRNFFSSTLESLCFTALKAGAGAESIVTIRTDTQLELARAATVFDVQAAFLEAAETIAEEIRRLLIGKHEKVISRVRQMLDRRLKDGRHDDTFSLADAAKALGVSTGHLSRTFRRVTGKTFRDYAMSRRIEHSCRSLLDPLNNVSVVASRCGFSSSAYFARVFRKFVGCAPTEYAKDPRRTPVHGPVAQVIGGTGGLHESQPAMNARFSD